MTLARQTQTNFTAGEISPRLLGRTDISKYYNGVSTLDNFIVQQHGPITRRPGTRFVADNLSGSAETRLIPFQFSTTQTFILAFQDDGNLFFFKDTGPVSISASTGVSYTSDGTASVLVLFDRPHGYTTSHTITVANATNSNADGTARVITSVPDNISLVYTAAQIVPSGTPASDTLDISADSADSFYTIRHGFVGANLDRLQYTQFGDFLYITDGDGVFNPEKISRFGDSDWNIEAVRILDGPYDAENDTSATFNVVSQSVDKVTYSAHTGITISHSDARDMSIGVASGSNPGGTVTARLVLILGAGGVHQFKQGDLIDVINLDNDSFNGSGFEITDVTLTTIDYKPGGSGFGATSITQTFNGSYAQFGVLDEELVPATSVFPSVVKKHRNGLTVSDYGRSTRMFNSSSPGCSVVELYRYHGATISSYLMTKLSSGALFGATSSFEMGLFSIGEGYPTSVSGHQSRLLLGKDFTAYASNIGLLDDFSPSDIDDFVVDATHSWSTAFIGDQVNNILWLASSSTGLMVGTSGAEYTVTDLGNTAVLNPVDGVATTVVTTYGTEEGTRPLQIGGSVIFVQSGGRKLRDLHFTFERDSQVGVDLTLLSEHITKDRIVELVYQQEPNSIIWCLTSTSELLSLTFEPEQEVSAWATHTLGGTDVTIDTIAVVKDIDGGDTVDRLWMVTNRTINGSSVRYVEYMDAPYSINDHYYDSNFVDSAISNAPVIVSNTSAAAYSLSDPLTDPATELFDSGNTLIVVTGSGSPFAGLSQNDELAFFDIDMNLVAKCVITSTGTPTNAITVTMRNNELPKASTPYANAIFYIKQVLLLSGLGHLDGEVVAINADGVTDGFESTKTVSGGSVSLTAYAAFVTVGLNYVSTMKTLPVQVQALAGVDAHARMGSIVRSHLEFYETSTFFLGTELAVDQFYPHTLRLEQETDSSKILNQERSGVFSFDTMSEDKVGPQLILTSGSDIVTSSKINNALPLTLLSITMDMDINAPA